MGRYSDLYKDLYGREPTDFPKPINALIEVGKSYRLKLLTEPRKVRAAYGRETPIVEVSYHDRRYTLYLSLVDMLNRFALLERQCEERGIEMKGKTIVLERTSKRRFNIGLVD